VQGLLSAMQPWPASYPETELTLIPVGPAGIRATLDKMVEHVTGSQGRRNPVVRCLAEKLTMSLPSRAWLGEVQALWNFVRTHIRYARDILNVETLKPPYWMLQMPVGDCDDHAMLLAALLNSMGHPCRFVAMGFKERDRYSHVLTETIVGDRWVPLETTFDVPFGWIPPRQVTRMPMHWK